MPMFIYDPRHVEPAEFVAFWSARYQYNREHLYDNNIGQELTEQRIYELFEWKNGTRLSEPKQESVHTNFVERLGELNNLPVDEAPLHFLQRFADGGAIWRIFWLHCWQPERFPIYDQHVHRAMVFIQEGVIGEIPSNGPQKIESYIQNYLPFYGSFAGIDYRSLDKALWAFGRFIKMNNFPVPAPQH